VKIKLELEKGEGIIAAHTFDVRDAQSFGDACRDMYMRLEQRFLGESANVGELMDMAGECVAQELDGVELRFTKA